VTGRAPLRIGLSLPTWPGRDRTNLGWAAIRDIARDAEALGVDTLWVPDHLERVVPGLPPFGFWECWTILAATAEATSRVEIGPLVTSTGFRNPGLVAKMAATLDEISGERLVLGIGSGVPATDESWRMFGFDSDRPVARMEEAVEVIARTLREPPLTFTGNVFHTEAAQVIPPGPRGGAIPIWIGAHGERTIGIAARWGDSLNIAAAISTAAEVSAMAERAATACSSVGRDPATLPLSGYGRLRLRADGTAVTGTGWLGGTREEVAATVAAMADAGLRHLTLYVGADDDPSPIPALTHETLERFAPLLETLRAG
jgi:alkanesulfonate monooxygenase SsuD/methylene tetrahydromethanopterin reductase-like flavin-dependent oxidoreductase (luciferase family)